MTRLSSPQPITVIKRRTDGSVAMRYTGQALLRTSRYMLVEAYFNIDHYTLPGGVELQRGDRFLELYETRRWYNVLQIHDKQDNRLKGWYCNISRPAQFEAEQVTYVDLALDLLVLPNGQQMVLDEDEFEALNLSDHVQQRARQGLAQVQSLFTTPNLPRALRPYLVFPPAG